MAKTPPDAEEVPGGSLRGAALQQVEAPRTTEGPPAEPADEPADATVRGDATADDGAGHAESENAQGGRERDVDADVDTDADAWTDSLSRLNSI